MVETQKLRFSSKELSFIKNTFADQEELLKLIRKVMLQLPLTEQEETEVIKHFHGKQDIMKILRKCFLPELDGDAPIHQTIDLWMTIKIDDKTPEEAKPFIEARRRLIDYIEQQLDELGGAHNKPKILFRTLTNGDYVDLTMRNTMIMHTEQQLNAINVMAGLKEETSEEQKKRLEKDSNK